MHFRMAYPKLAWLTRSWLISIACQMAWGVIKLHPQTKPAVPLRRPHAPLHVYTHIASKYYCSTTVVLHQHSSLHASLSMLVLPAANMRRPGSRHASKCSDWGVRLGAVLGDDLERCCVAMVSGEASPVSTCTATHLPCCTLGAFDGWGACGSGAKPPSLVEDRVRGGRERCRERILSGA